MGWDRFSTLEAASRFGPAGPGVYAIGKVTRLHGLPLAAEWVYIGMAKSLRVRISQHLPYSEVNKPLRAWIQANHSSVEIWTRKLESEAAADSLETHLISTLNPQFNTMKRTNLGT